MVNGPRPLEPRPFGGTGLSVPPLCVGTSGWGRLRPGEDEAARTARVAALADQVLRGADGLNYLDTSNIYGRGTSEAVIGAALGRAGGQPDGVVVQTKLDRNLADNDFSAGQMWRSLEQSLTRLGLDRLQVLFLHDPEVVGFEAVMTPGGAVETLVEMKRQGLAGAIGISGAPVAMMTRFVATGWFDVLISHNRYTLVDRSAGPLFAAAKARGMGVNNAAPYGGGALSGRPGAIERYGYRPVHPEVRAAIEAMTRACAAVAVPLSAAALQFSLRDPLVDSTVVGVSALDRLDAALADAAVTIPAGLWDELEQLRPPESAALDRI